MHLFKRHKLLFLLCFATLILCVEHTPSLAKIKKSKFSSEEDVAIAFYRTGNVRPNFDSWIKEREPYINTPWSLRQDMYNHEQERLSRAYQSFDPQKDMVMVQTFSQINLKEEGSDPKKYKLNAKFEKAPEAGYFPYNFLGERIIVVPYGLHKIMDSEISAEKYKYLKERILSSNSLRTVIHMRPYSSDFSKPHKIDGIYQWVFRTKIASLEFWDRDSLVWQYTAPWYSSSNSREMKKIYELRPKNSNSKKGNIKPLGDSFD